MNTPQTVLLAGASGVLGQHITRTLTAAGHHVIGMGRSGTNEIAADLLDREAVLRGVDGRRADVVVHAATALRSPPMRHNGMFATNDLRITGTRNLLAAARAIGAQLFIGENIVFGYGYRDFGNRVLTETDPFGRRSGDHNVDRHLDGMRLKEQLALESGIPAISLRYGLFYGEGGTDAIVDLLRRHRIPVTNDGGRVLAWVNLVDAASAVLAAMERGRPGEAYNIVDDSRVGFSGMVRAVAEATGAPTPPTVPRWFTNFTPFVHTLMGVNMRVSSAKARAELGWRPTYPTIVDGLRAQAAAAGTAAR